MKLKNTELVKITGIIEKNPRGFGFVRQEDGADIFIAPDNMGGAMSGDMVEADLLPPYLWTRSREGIIVKVLERKTTEVVGTFQKNRQYGFVVPDDKKSCDDIFIKRDFFRNAQNGDKVVAKITKYPEGRFGAEGKITEIIAQKGQTGSAVMSMIRARGLFETFPSRVMLRQKHAQRN